MRFVIVTGMSGAGKSVTLKMMEDMGFFCVDNLPVPLIPRLSELLGASEGEITKAALGVDIRSGEGFKELRSVLKEMDEAGQEYEILFLEANDDTLIRRYKETRRSHPLSGKSGKVDQGIAREREKLQFLKDRADFLIDTSHMLTRELKKQLGKIFLENKAYENLFVSVVSFGFKYGIPRDADLVFDVRFLPNPYYIEEMRLLTGNDEPIQNYVMENGKAEEFLKKLMDMLTFLVPNYIHEGKTQLVVAIGCTGGKHRSVTIANELYHELEKLDNYGTRVEHRDIGKDAVTKAR